MRPKGLLYSQNPIIVPYPCPLNPAHTLPSCFFYFLYYPPIYTRWTNCSPSSRLPYKNFSCTSVFLMYVTSYLIYLDLITLIIFNEEYKLWSSTLCNLLHCLVTLSLSDPNILLSVLFSDTLTGMQEIRELKNCPQTQTSFVFLLQPLKQDGAVITELQGQFHIHVWTIFV